MTLEEQKVITKREDAYRNVVESMINLTNVLGEEVNYYKNRAESLTRESKEAEEKASDEPRSQEIHDNANHQDAIDIDEDYPSIETCKLLKEKGFNEVCQFYSDNVKTDYGSHYHRNSELPDNRYSCPTLQMAMKWLRYRHNTHICVTQCIRNHGGNRIVDWDGSIYWDGHIVDTNTHNTEEISGFDTYEDACDYYLRYCLKKLL